MRDINLFKRTKESNIKGRDYIQTYWTLIVDQSDSEVEVIKFLNESDLLELQEQIKEALKPQITSEVLK